MAAVLAGLLVLGLTFYVIANGLVQWLHVAILGTAFFAFVFARAYALYHLRRDKWRAWRKPLAFGIGAIALVAVLLGWSLVVALPHRHNSISYIGTMVFAAFVGAGAGEVLLPARIRQIAKQLG